jgi:hypothetical protein
MLDYALIAHTWALAFAFILAEFALILWNPKWYASIGIPLYRGIVPDKGSSDLDRIVSSQGLERMPLPDGLAAALASALSGRVVVARDGDTVWFRGKFWHLFLGFWGIRDVFRGRVFQYRRGYVVEIRAMNGLVAASVALASFAYIVAYSNPRYFWIVVGVYAFAIVAALLILLIGARAAGKQLASFLESRLGFQGRTEGTGYPRVLNP